MTQILPTIPMTTTDGKFLAPGGQKLSNAAWGKVDAFIWSVA